jgi:hypothetical protein
MTTLDTTPKTVGEKWMALTNEQRLQIDNDFLDSNGHDWLEEVSERMPNLARASVHCDGWFDAVWKFRKAAMNRS